MGESGGEPSALAKRWNVISQFSRLVHERLIVGAALARISLGYCQCIAMMTRFQLVRWPSLFDGFLRALEQLNLEIFDLIPAECAIGQRLGFYVELTGSLVAPPIMGSVLLILALIIANSSGPERTDDAAGKDLDGQVVSPVGAD